MNKILNLVLTSRDIRLLRRALHSLPVENTAIVCNTTDHDYRLELKNSDLNERYDIVYTESNGLPGKGHQSCLDIFLKTDYDYLIKIDGDDFLMPKGYSKLLEQINGDHDVIGVHNECMMIREDFFTTWRRLREENPDTPWAPPGIEIPDVLRQKLETIFQYDWYRNVVYSREGAAAAEWDELLPCLEDSDFNRRLEDNGAKIKIVDCESIYVWDRIMGGDTFLKFYSTEGHEAYEKVFLKEGMTNKINQGLDRVKLDAFYTMDEIREHKNKLNEIYGVTK